MLTNKYYNGDLVPRMGPVRPFANVTFNIIYKNTTKTEKKIPIYCNNEAKKVQGAIKKCILVIFCKYGKIYISMYIYR